MTMRFDRFYAWSKRELKLQLDGYKENQLQRRITTIMRKSGAENLEIYAKLIEGNPKLRKEFLDYITINVTEFFRNKQFFDEFEQAFLARHGKNSSQLRLWSAACSTGAEAHSLAILLHRNGLASISRIIGTDIDETILTKAREAIYMETDIRNVEGEDRQRYFLKEDNRYRLKEEVKRMASFRKQDLILDSYETGFHAILCRNVTIYFKDEVKDAIYSKISNSLVPGGIFFTGATETVYHPEQYGLKKIGSFLYEKV